MSLHLECLLHKHLSKWGIELPPAILSPQKRKIILSIHYPCCLSNLSYGNQYNTNSSRINRGYGQIYIKFFTYNWRMLFFAFAPIFFSFAFWIQAHCKRASGSSDNLHYRCSTMRARLSNFFYLCSTWKGINVVTLRVVCASNKFLFSFRRIKNF